MSKRPDDAVARSCDYLDGRRDGYATAIRDVLAEMDEPRREIVECEHDDVGVWGCPYCLRMAIAGWMPDDVVGQVRMGVSGGE